MNLLMRPHKKRTCSSLVISSILALSKMMLMKDVPDFLVGQVDVISVAKANEVSLWIVKSIRVVIFLKVTDMSPGENMK